MTRNQLKELWFSLPHKVKDEYTLISVSKGYVKVSQQLKHGYHSFTQYCGDNAVNKALELQTEYDNSRIILM